jgi:hypothetical protein
LEREKETLFTDNETGRMEEFVVMDRISVTEEELVIIEGKRSSVREAMKQCLFVVIEGYEKQQWWRRSVRFRYNRRNLANAQKRWYVLLAVREDEHAIQYNGRDSREMDEGLFRSWAACLSH